MQIKHIQTYHIFYGKQSTDYLFILTQIRKWLRNSRTILLSGGELFLFGYLFQLVRYIRNISHTFQLFFVFGDLNIVRTYVRFEYTWIKSYSRYTSEHTSLYKAVLFTVIHNLPVLYNTHKMHVDISEIFFAWSSVACILFLHVNNNNDNRWP